MLSFEEGSKVLPVELFLDQGRSTGVLDEGLLLVPSQVVECRSFPRAHAVGLGLAHEGVVREHLFVALGHRQRNGTADGRFISVGWGT